MKIQYVRATVKPWVIDDTRRELHLEVLVDGTIHNSCTVWDQTDFESAFDYLFDQVKEAIRRVAIKESQPRQEPIENPDQGLSVRPFVTPPT